MKNLLLVLCLVSNIVFGVTANKVWRIPSGGTLGAWGPINLADNTNAVTGLLPRSNIGSLGQQTSSSSGSFSTGNATYTDVTNLTVTFTTNGRPVMLMIQPDGSNPGTIGLSGSASSQFTLGWARDGSVFSEITTLINPSVSGGLQIPPGSFNIVDTGASAGSHTWKVQVKRNAGTSVIVTSCVIVAYEL